MLILTRPASQNASWAKALHAQGLATLALPLVEITLLDAPALAACRRRLADSMQEFSAIMHVSPNAVAGLWDTQVVQQWLSIRRIRPGLAPRLWAPGPGTARALQARGFPAACIDQPGKNAALLDSEALWQTVENQVTPGRRFLLVRGVSVDRYTESASTDAVQAGNGRDWLAQQIARAGAVLEPMVVYQRRCPVWDAAQQLAVRQAMQQGAVWLFSSAESVSHLARLLPACNWQAYAAIATHPRIADAALRLGMGRVLLAAPDVPAISSAYHTI